MKYFMTFSYDGSNFSGYQKQPRERTVQACLENALKESTIMEKEYKDGKRNGYNNANEMMSSILND